MVAAKLVRVLYLLEGGGLTLIALFAADQFAATWASAPVGSLDDVAVRGIRVAGLPGVFTWVLLGVMMLIFSRVPARASLLVVRNASSSTGGCSWELRA